MSFHDERLPLAWSHRARRTWAHPVEVTELPSGREVRNLSTAEPRLRLDIPQSDVSAAAAQALQDFFWRRQGPLHAFRFRDQADWKSCAPDAAPSPLDQPIGVGDGTQRTFQLTKTMLRDAEPPVARRIALPVALSVSAAVAGVTVAPAGWSVATLTGLITFLTPPTAGSTITAGFAFDVRVRFADADLRIEQVDERLHRVGAFSLVEVRP